MAGKAECSTLVVKILLTALFVGLIVTKIMEWNQEQTGISIHVLEDMKSAPLPEISVCIPFGKNMTNLSLEDAFPKDFGIKKAGFYDVQNDHIEDFKVKLSFYSDVGFDDHYFGWCFTFYSDLDEKMSPSPFSAVIKMDMAKIGIEKFHYLAFEIQEKGQSLMNSMRRFENVRYIDNGTNFVYAGVKLEMVKKLSTHNHKCNEDRNAKLHQCAEKYYMKKMNCSFPWVLNSSLPVCKSIDDVKKLHGHQTKMITQSAESWKELKSMDCWLPNCVQNYWNFFAMKNIVFDEEPKNEISFDIEIITNNVSCIENFHLFS